MNEENSMQDVQESISTGGGVVIVNHHVVPVGDYALLEDDQRDRAHHERFFNKFGWPKLGIDHY